MGKCFSLCEIIDLLIICEKYNQNHFNDQSTAKRPHNTLNKSWFTWSTCLILKGAAGCRVICTAAARAHVQCLTKPGFDWAAERAALMAAREEDNKWTPETRSRGEAEPATAAPAALVPGCWAAGVCSAVRLNVRCLSQDNNCPCFPSGCSCRSRAAADSFRVWNLQLGSAGAGLFVSCWYRD